MAYDGPRIITSNFQAPIEIISAFQYRVRTDFDPDLSPNHPANTEAARQRGLRFDSSIDAFVDEDGLPIRDKFGQELG